MRTKLYILALIIMLTAVTNIYAQKGTSLTLSIYDGSAFTVEFDNNAYTKQSEELTIEGIAGGKHHLKVIASGSKAPVFSGYINLSDGYTTRAVIDDYKSFYVYQKYRYRKTRGSNETIDWERHYGDIGYGEENNYRVISDIEFTDLMNIVRTKTYDNTKLEICKLAIENSFFTTEMVSSMIKLLTFETYRLELAKYAYGKTVDKRNYLKIFDTFKYEFSITELKEYIQGYK